MKRSIAFSTMITVPILLVAILVSSCTKVKLDDDFPKGDPPPVPGGYTNSSQVATANLLAYWNFDSSSNEIKSNTAPSVVKNVTAVKGIKGQGLRFTSGFALYPTISALSSAAALSSCSVSLWVNFANNGSQASEFFALVQPPAVQSDWLAIINVAAETGRAASEQNLVFHSWVGSYATGERIGGDNINDYGAVGTDYQTFSGANKWVHYVMRYDATATAIDLYANGNRVSNNNFRVRRGLGPIVMPVPTQVLLGAFPTVAAGFPLSGTQSWQSLLTGSIDELRVFNKALNDQEISALFQLEKQGR